MVYEKNEVYPDAILRIDLDGVFEGYARLIEPCGRYFCEMISDRSPVIISRRWLVEFVILEDAPVLSKSQRFTQIAQCQRRTHRNIKFIAGEFVKAQKQYGDNTQQEPVTDNKELPIDDFSGAY